jgi:NlpC/P60 family putative phage cell wall peptidase
MPPSLHPAAAVAAAREWIGTPYHNCADVKGVGVDCGMLLVRIYVDLKLVTPFDPRPYSPDWHLHRSEEKYLGHLLARAESVARPEPGDVVLFRYGRCYSHGGVVTRADPLTIIHAFHPAGLVLEEEVARNAELAARLGDARFFTLWSKAP